jgi:hypothetical protein
MSGALDLASKVIAALAALLGLAGYVYVLGAIVLWIRLDDAGLPHEAPISIASRQELVTIGGQAVAVWGLLVLVLGVLAIWIAAGKPEQRRFRHRDAALAIALTVSVVLAHESPAPALVALPCVAMGITALVSLAHWPTIDIELIATAILPAGVGLGLGFALAAAPGNGLVGGIGATVIFAALMLLAPRLQRWQARPVANQSVIADLEVRLRRRGQDPEKDPLIAALKNAAPGEGGPDRARWLRIVALAVTGLVALGVIAVASQIDSDHDFHEAVVSLTDGDCVKGTYIARGSEQIVLAQPGLGEEAEREEPKFRRRRIATIPTEDVLEVQIFGKEGEGGNLRGDHRCRGDKTLVHPIPPAEGNS